MSYDVGGNRGLGMVSPICERLMLKCSSCAWPKTRGLIALRREGSASWIATALSEQGLDERFSQFQLQSCAVQLIALDYCYRLIPLHSPVSSSSGNSDREKTCRLGDRRPPTRACLHLYVEGLPPSASFSSHGAPIAETLADLQSRARIRLRAALANRVVPLP